MAAATTILQRESKLLLLSLRKHLGGVMQIFPHTDVDMWGHLSRSDFVRAELKNDGDWFRPDHNSQTPGTPGREIRILLIAGG